MREKISPSVILLVVGIIDLIFALGGLYIWSFVLEGTHDVVLALTAFLLGVTTFFGLMIYGQREGKESSPTKSGTRLAITAAMVVTYLFVLAMAIFGGARSGDLAPITSNFITSFTNVIGVIIAFYFASSAAVQILEKKAPGDDSQPESNSEEPPAQNPASPKPSERGRELEYAPEDQHEVDYSGTKVKPTRRRQ